MAGIQRAEHPGELRRMTKKPNDSPEVGCGDERVTKLEEVAKSMYLNIPWGGGSDASWEYAPVGLKQHYMIQAAVAVKAMRSENSTWNAGIDAILNEIQE
jgi:hypothetical protein